jgi:YVTN family beta-propeller protein
MLQVGYRRSPEAGGDTVSTGSGDDDDQSSSREILMTGPRRPSLQDREPRLDLFDDPPWDDGRDGRRSPLAWLRQAAFVLLVIGFGLLGLVLIGAVVSFVVLMAGGFHLNLGSINFSPPPPSSYGVDIALSSDGSLAYVTEPSADRLVVLNTRTGAVLANVVVGNTPSGLALSPDGNQVWVVNTDLSSGLSSSGSSSDTGGTDSVSVVSTWTDSVVGTVDVGPGPIDVAFSPDGHRAYVTNNGALGPGSVNVINTATLAVVETLAPSTPPPTGSLGWNPTSVAVTPDGHQVWVSEVNDLNESNVQGSASPPDFVYVFATGSTAQIAQIPVGTGPFFMVLSRDGRDAFVADKVSCDVREIDTTTFRVVATVPWPSTHGCPFGLAAGPDTNSVDTVTGTDHTFNEASAGNSFGSVDFATSHGLLWP